MSCQNQITFCKLKCCECSFIGKEAECPNHSITCGGDNIPSFHQWTQIYMNLAKKRNEKTGMLAKSSVKHIMSSLNEFKTVMGYSDDDKVSEITRKNLSIYCDKICCLGITKKSKCEKICQAFAKWIRHETEDTWVIPKIERPDILDESERFHEPSQELLIGVAKWYRSLHDRGRGMFKNRDRLYSMFMYSYAMRNSDVDMLKWSNIENVNGRFKLCYTPHKTRLSSKRHVKIWMDPLDYTDLMEFKETSRRRGESEYIFGGGKNIALKNRLNAEIKDIGFTGKKGLYILRKICIHMTFKKFGQEAASAISGDDFNTVKVHYADPDSIEVSANSNGIFC